MKTINSTAVMIILAIIFATPSTYAQGCSDAGFCTIPTMEGDYADNLMNYVNSLTTGITYGVGDKDVAVVTPYILYERNINSDWTLSSKVTYTSIKGDLGDNSGFGDLFVTAGYKRQMLGGNVLGLTAGFKVPLNKADGGDGSESLPMYYQTTVESFDIIMGASYTFGNMLLSIGIQQPLSGANSNTFLAGDYPGLQSDYAPFTNKFQRKGDILVRAAYEHWIIKNKILVRPSLLPIVHLGEDRYVDSDGVERSIAGSSGVTLNFGTNVRWLMDDRNTVEFIFGAPVITRDVRPDGLTRHFVVGLEYGIGF